MIMFLTHCSGCSLKVAAICVFRTKIETGKREYGFRQQIIRHHGLMRSRAELFGGCHAISRAYKQMQLRRQISLGISQNEPVVITLV